MCKTIDGLGLNSTIHSLTTRQIAVVLRSQVLPRHSAQSMTLPTPLARPLFVRSSLLGLLHQRQVMLARAKSEASTEAVQSDVDLQLVATNRNSLAMQLEMRKTGVSSRLFFVNSNNFMQFFVA